MATFLGMTQHEIRAINFNSVGIVEKYIAGKKSSLLARIVVTFAHMLEYTDAKIIRIPLGRSVPSKTGYCFKCACGMVGAESLTLVSLVFSQEYLAKR